VRRFFWAVFLLVSLAVLGAGGWGLWWVYQPLHLPAPTVDLSIEQGTLPRGVAQAVKDAGVDVNPDLLYLWFRVSGQGRAIKAGSYELEKGITPHRLLSKLARGEESLRAVTLVEGLTFRQFRAVLAKEDVLKPDTKGLADDAVMALLGRPGLHPEGRFFPDTYTYAKGSSDVAVLRRAMRAMDKRLAAAWAERSPNAAVKTPDEALILASIIEKETGKAGDRPLVAAVFNNRLRMGMPLQTDPGAMRPGQRSSKGTRKAPSQLVFFSLRKGVVPPSGQLLRCGPLSVEYWTMVLSATPISSSRSSIWPTFLS